MFTRFKKFVMDGKSGASPVELAAMIGAISAFEKIEAKDAANAIKLPFGKHKNETVNDVHSTYKGKKYIQWLVRQDWFSEGDWSELKVAFRGLGYTVPNGATQATDPQIVDSQIRAALTNLGADE